MEITGPRTTLKSARPSARPSASVSTAEAERVKRLRMFVIGIVLKTLKKVDYLQTRSKEEWVSHTKILVERTLVGLAVAEGFIPDFKSSKALSRRIVKELLKKFGDKETLLLLVKLRDSVVDEAIVKVLQAHIVEHSAKPVSESCLSVYLVWLGLLGVLVGTLVILALF